MQQTNKEFRDIFYAGIFISYLTINTENIQMKFKKPNNFT